MSTARLSDPVRLANPSSLFPPLMAPKTPARRFVARDCRVPCDATPFLLLDDGEEAIEARPVDMSDSGIYVTIDPAVGSPVHNGDHVDVCFAPAGDAPAEAATARHPAKVVRVELLVGPSDERLGVALAFES